MKQKISECMDGELDAESAARILGQLANSEGLRADWMIYHMIGDGMRDAPDLSPAFAARLSERLAAEPTVLAPRRIVSGRGFTQVAAYAAAALAAVAVVGWFAVNPELSPGGPQLAQQTIPGAPAEKVALQRPAISPLKPRDHDYLMAHQAVSPGGAMQGVAPYVRTVSFGTEANDR